MRSSWEGWKEGWGGGWEGIPLFHELVDLTKYTGPEGGMLRAISLFVFLLQLLDSHTSRLGFKYRVRGWGSATSILFVIYYD